MSLWEIESSPWPLDTFSNVVPVEVLAAYDGPLTFVFQSKLLPSLMLAHLAAAEERLTRYIAVPTDDAILARLKSGAISIRAALDQPLAWIVDLDSDGKTVGCWAQKIAQLPPGAIPEDGVMLYPNLDPLLRLRSPNLHVGTMPASDIRYLVEGAENAIRKLTNFAQQKTSLGRPDEDHRKLYRLEVQELRAASLSISFRSSPPPAFLVNDDHRSTVLSRVEDMLSRGLRWSQTGELPSTDDAETEAILDAIKDLSPRRGATASVIEVSGRVADRFEGNIRLTRTQRDLAGETLKGLRSQRPQPNFLGSLGQVREADKDRYSFILRGRPNNAEPLQFEYDDEHKEAVMDAFYDDYQVYVIGRPSGKGHELINIVDVNAIGSPSPQSQL